jgi:ubiquinol-cytochrome c reductase cytochrome b subunit
MKVDPLTFVDQRVGAARPIRKALDYIFPDHWSFLLGEIALYAFVVLIGTGTFLAFFFEPSSATTTLDGETVSHAYASAIRLSYDVPGGLLMRQTHHWAANVFVCTCCGSSSPAPSAARVS